MADSREINIRVSAKDETGGVFAKLRERLDSLKRVAGGRSTTKELVETIGGAGAIAGIGLAASELGELSEKAGEFALSFSEIGPEVDHLRAAFEDFVPFGHTMLNIADGIDDIVAAIGRANGASDAFVERWESAPSKIREAKAAIDYLNHVRSVVSEGPGGAAGGFGQDLNNATLRGRELADINQSTREAQDAQKIRQLRESLDQDLTLSPELRAAGERNIDNAEKVAARAHAAERRRIAEDDAAARANAEMQAQARIASIEATGRETEFREHGRFLEADLDQLRASSDAQIEQIKRVSAEQERVNPERFQEIEARTIKEIDAIQKTEKAQEEAATRSRVNERLNQRFGVQTQVKEASIDSLRVEAELGGVAANIQLEQAQIAEQYRQKRNEINRELREDLTLTAEQRDSLKGILSGLDAQEDKEKRIAALKHLQLNLSSAEASRGDTGVVNAFKARASDIRSGVLDVVGSAAQASRGAGGASSLFTAGSPVATHTQKTAEESTKQTDIQQQTLNAIRQLVAAIQGGTTTSIFN